MRRTGILSKSGLAAILLAAVVIAVAVQAADSQQHYQLISSIEYKGEELFSNRAETDFTVQTQDMGDHRVRHSIMSDKWQGDYSFVVDHSTGKISASTSPLRFQQSIANACVNSLQGVVKENIGTTWKESIDLSAFGSPLPEQIRLTMTAQQFTSETLGDVIAVRAMSEPFEAMISDPAQQEAAEVKCRVNSIYLFDSNIDEVYMSASVFKLTRQLDLMKKGTLVQQTGTYRTASDGSAIDLGMDPKSKTGKEFAKFVKSVGLLEKRLKIKEDQQLNLPSWAQSDAMAVAQVANICAGTSCEGAVNPVGPLFMAGNTLISQQSMSLVGGISGTSVGTTMTASLGTGSLASSPFLGIGAGAAGAIGGGTAGGVAAGGGFSGGGGGGSSDSASNGN